MDWKSIWRRILPGRMIRPDVEEEIAFHIEGRIQELVREGWDPEEARAHVLARFGDVDEVERVCRDYATQRVDGMMRRETMGEWMREVRLAARRMVRSPGFTLAVVLTLALGIGATTAVFSTVEAFLLRPLPYAEPDRLMMVWENDRATGTVRENASPSDYYDFVERSRVFEGLALYAPNAAVLTRPGAEPARLATAQVTAGLPAVLGVGMQLGRGFTPEEDQPGGALAVVLTHAFWEEAFQGDREVLGASLSIDDRPHTVVGVLPEGIRFPSPETDVWVPIQLSPAVATRPNHWVSVVGRLGPEATVGEAQQEMSAIMAQLEEEYPEDNTNRGAFVEPLAEVGRGDVRATLWVLFGSVLGVLAIACVNAANLLLARNAARGQEMAVHLALGAGQGALRRRHLVEGLLLTGTGAALGLLLAGAGVRFLPLLAPDRLTLLGTPSLNASVLGFTLLVTGVLGMGFGLLPALGSGRKRIRSFLAAGRSGGGRVPRLGVRRALVAAQLALAVVLLLGATLLMRTLQNLQAVDPGFESANVLRMTYTLPPTRYPRDFADFPDFREVHAFHRALLQEVEELPGVQAAAVVTNHPLDRGFTNSFAIEGRGYDPEQGEITTRMVSPGYFETTGLRLVEGRLLDPAAGPLDSHQVVLNRRAVERYFPDGGAVGSRIAFWGISREVVGIVENERMHGLTEATPPALYMSVLQSPPVATPITLMVRTRGAPLELVEPVRQVIWGLDRDLAIFNVATMEDTLADAMDRERFASTLLLVFASVAVFLAVLGVHGVLSYLVAQRGHEVGVRMALGASPTDVVRGVVGEGAGMLGGGLAAGVAGALILSRFLESLLFGVTATAPWAYLLVVAALGAAALAGTALPAWRAASISPARTLKGE